MAVIEATDESLVIESIDESLQSRRGYVQLDDESGETWEQRQSQEARSVIRRYTTIFNQYSLAVASEGFPVSGAPPLVDRCELVDHVRFGGVCIRLVKKMIVDIRRADDSTWRAHCTRLPIPPATAPTGREAFDKFKKDLAEVTERLRQTAAHEMSEEDSAQWQELSRVVDWTRYHIENPSLQYCYGRVCGWQGNLAEIEWLLSPFVDEPEPTFALVHKQFLPSELWQCEPEEEFEAKIRPPKRAYPVWFKVRERSLQSAGREGVPEDVLSKLKPIVGLMFPTLTLFKGRLRMLISSEEFAEHGEQILEKGVFCESDPMWYADDDCQWVEVTRMGIDSESSEAWLERLARVIG